MQQSSGVDREPDVHRQVASELAAELGRHARLMHGVKATMVAFVPDGMDLASFPVLMQLVKGGPTRQGELADHAVLDPSTISRYVGALVRSGLVERRPAPHDGRAVVLAATERGEDLAQQMLQHRDRLFADVLTDWDTQDVEALTDLMRRFNASLENHRQAPPSDR